MTGVVDKVADHTSGQLIRNAFRDHHTIADGRLGRCAFKESTAMDSENL